MKKKETEHKEKKIEETRDKQGRFTKGNTIGKKSRFKEGNIDALKYKDEFCDMLLEYFSQPSTRIEYQEKYSRGQLVSKIPVTLPNEYPTFEMFAAKIGVTTDTLRNWAEDNPRFKHYYSRAKEIQLAKLTSNTLIGVYNPIYAKFEATNNHGLKDKQEVATNVSGELSTGIDEKTRALIERVEKRLKNG